MAVTRTHDRGADREIERLVSGEHPDPHRLLGAHMVGDHAVIRAWYPGADELGCLVDGQTLPMERIHTSGLFQVQVKASSLPAYRFVKTDGTQLADPYGFWPTIGELDLYLIGEGRHQDLWRFMGAHLRTVDTVDGCSFAVWAPNAKSVRVVGDFNAWDGRCNPMRSLGSSGIWEIFLPGVGEGALYKFEILTRDGRVLLKGDPYAAAAEVPPGTASRVFRSTYGWQDEAWMSRRAATDPLISRMSIYECHLGSFMRVPEESDRPLTYRELADVLPAYLVKLGFTHVELLPVSEHPFGGSWGYQVSYYYAPTSRFGSPDDLRYLIDRLHQEGIGVILDWVPAHFPKDDFALSRFDGTALYEHSDPRQGEQPDWGTLVFNLGRNEVRNFLMANAMYWLEEFHVDGLRVDAVASMLYLDYSRKEGEWVPNRFGGRENLEAVEFLKDLNTRVYGRFPGIMTIAEESTAWPGVSRPAHLGGLGFGFKWNMGWMHDTLRYISKDPIHRRFHHNDLTFGLLYAWHENFILPISHDEVVHGKRSLLGKMPGDEWQRLANHRALLGWMWAHPGKQLLFMGAELADPREWSHDQSLGWHLLDEASHSGVQTLVAALNRVARERPALWQLDHSPEGFRWIDANDLDSNVLSFARYSKDGQVLVCVANFSPVTRFEYRIGLPAGGTWDQVLNTDSAHFGGSGAGTPVLEAEEVSWHGLDHSARIVLPPLGVVWLAPRRVDEAVL